MPYHVINTWQASDHRDVNGNYVHIKGRSGGLLSFILTLFGLSPTIELTVNDSMIMCKSGAANGMEERHTPLEHICSTNYGVMLPWLLSVFLGIVAAGVTALICKSQNVDSTVSFVFAGPIVGIIIWFIVYFLFRTYTVGFSDVSGHSFQLFFSPASLLDGTSVNQELARTTCAVIQQCISMRHSGQSAVLPASSPDDATGVAPQSISGIPAIPPPPPPIMPAVKLYYYASSDLKPQGPLSFADLLSLAKTGAIGPTTKVIAEGDAQWQSWESLQVQSGVE